GGGTHGTGAREDRAEGADLRPDAPAAALHARLLLPAAGQAVGVPLRWRAARGRRQGVRAGAVLDARDPAPRTVLGGRPPRERPPPDDARSIGRARAGLEARGRELDRRA